MSGTQWRAGAQAPQAASVTLSFVPQEENSQDRLLRPVCLAVVLTVPTLAQPPSPLALFSRWKSKSATGKDSFLWQPVRAGQKRGICSGTNQVGGTVRLPGSPALTEQP